MRLGILFFLALFVTNSFFYAGMSPAKRKTYAFLSLVNACEHSEDKYLQRRGTLVRTALDQIIKDFENGDLDKKFEYGSALFGVLDYKGLLSIKKYEDIAHLPNYIVPKLQKHLYHLHGQIALKMQEKRAQRKNKSCLRLQKWQAGVIQMHLLIDDIQRLHGYSENTLMLFNPRKSREDRWLDKKIILPTKDSKGVS